MKRRRARKPVVRQAATKQDLMNYLRKIGVTDGSLVMAHTSVSGLSFDPDATIAEGSGNSLKIAQELATVLLELVGETGTLVVPTHPVYKNRSSRSAATDPPETPIYNPSSTPSGVGISERTFPGGVPGDTAQPIPSQHTRCERAIGG